MPPTVNNTNSYTVWTRSRVLDCPREWALAVATDVSLDTEVPLLQHDIARRRRRPPYSVMSVIGQNTTGSNWQVPSVTATVKAREGACH